MSDKSNYLAEITDSTVGHFIAQCWRWDTVPGYGSLVCAEQGASRWYGVVYRVHAGSDDPSRAVFAYQKTLDELRAEQPQIFEFLKTEISALLIGYVHNEQLSYGSCPLPVMVHTFVRIASVQECTQILRDPHYLHQLFAQAHMVGSIDELLFALFSQAKLLKVLNREMIIASLDVFNALSDQDYRRLRMLAQRLEGMMQS